MFFRKALLPLAALALMTAAPAHAQSTRSQLDTLNNQNISANGHGQITGPILNNVLGNIINSIGALVDNNTWTGTNAFSSPPILTGQNGYCYANGSSPMTCAAAVPFANLSGQATFLQLPTIGSNTFLGNSTGGSAAPTALAAGSGVISALGNATNATGGVLVNPAPFTVLSGQATLTQLPSIGASTLLGNSTGGSATPTALAVGSGVITALGNTTNAAGGVLVSPAPLAQLANIGQYTILGNNTNASGVPTALSGLPSPGQFYVNLANSGSPGLDTNDCLAASSGGGHGPCLTTQHGINVALGYSFGNTTPTLHVAGSTAATTSLYVTGTMGFEGNGSCCSAGLIIDGGGAAVLDDSSTIDSSTLALSTHAKVILQNITIQHAGASAGASDVFVQENSVLFTNGGVTFGSAGSSGQMIHGESAATIEQTGGITIKSGASVGSFIGLSSNAQFIGDGYTITCLGPATFPTGFLFADSKGVFRILSSTTFSGCGSVTARHYNLVGLSLLDLNGSSSLVSSIPGNSPGVVQGGALITPMPAPTINACTNGAIVANSTDEDFAVGFTGNSASCALTWGMGTQPNAPICPAPGSTAGGSIGMVPTTSGVTLTGSFVNGQTLYVHCKHAPSS